MPENANIKLDDFTITNSKQKKLFGIISFHNENLSEKENLKLSALSRVAPFVNLQQKKILSNAFFQSF